MCVCALRFACAMSFMMVPRGQACDVSSVSPLLRWWHGTSPKGALRPSHNSSLSNSEPRDSTYQGLSATPFPREGVPIPDAVRELPLMPLSGCARNLVGTTPCAQWRVGAIPGGGGGQGSEAKYKFVHLQSTFASPMLSR